MCEIRTGDSAKGVNLGEFIIKLLVGYEPFYDSLAVETH